MPVLQLLIVEDNADDAELLLRDLRRAGFDPEWSRVETELDFLAALENAPELILSDYSMPRFSGLRALELLRASGRDIPFILISGTVGEEVAVQAMRDGATDYLLKDRPARLASAVRRALTERHLRTERSQAEAAQAQLAAIVTSSADAIIGKDLNGIITSWNSGAERLFGYVAAEMVGTSILRLIPADRQDEEDRILEKIRQGESVERFETLRQTRDRGLIDVSVTASPIKDATGKVTGASKVARDISERKRAEKELRFQQTMLTTERELTLDGILVVDDQSRVLSFNGRFAQMWGISANILSTRADTVLLQAVRDKLVDPERFMELVRQLYDRHDQVSHDEVGLTDGRVFDRYSAPMRDSDGRYYGRVWYFRDVTERRDAEAALRRERDRAQRYLDASEVMLVALDMQGRITLANRYACSVLGWTANELLGRDWFETCIPAGVRDARRQKFQDVLRADLTIVDNPILTRFGQERLIEWRHTALRDDAGRVVGMFSSGTDITERHEAVEALRTAEARMRFALEAADVGIWDIDYATGVLRWSEILEAQYGLQPGTFGGTFEAFVERIHPDDRESVLEAVTKAMKSGTDFSVLHRTILPDGTVRWLSGAGRVLIDEHGTPLRGVGISLDVTERRTLEEQYQQAQKMEAVGRLAGGVAHDFNNLLTVILGYCELLLTDLDPDDPRLTDILEIQKAGTRAGGLTRQLLAFSRKQIIEPTLLDLNQIATDLQAMLERLIGEDVTIVLGLQPGLAPVMADRGQVEQIVMNLAVNARDAMPKGGTLTIETANVELDELYAKTHVALKPGPYVRLAVTDTGTGMTPQVQARLFEPFFTTKEPGKGTGLGMATVYGIVTRSGGTVDVYSEVGKGTAFKVYFPRADAAEAVVDTPAPTARPRGGTQTVLVVEDEEGLRELARKLLQRRGYTVLVAGNADEALRLFEQNPSIDLLLTDVVMPGASGPQLTRQLIEQRPGLKVIYMSGYTEDAIVQHGVLKPGIAFLNKPFTSQTLGDKIREVLER
jgi:two-component system, cell cycle sensor histidine kinase and response regulator CckA